MIVSRHRRELYSEGGWIISSILLALTLLSQIPAPTVYTGPGGCYSIITPGPTTVTYTPNSITLSWGAVPNPAPPSPSPPSPTPDPVAPAPIPVPGLRVLIIYEASKLANYVPSQTKILFDASLRTYLNSATVIGPDQKTHEYRFWDKDVVLTNEPALWRDVMARPHPKIPWIVISNGTTGFEGPLPMNTMDTIRLIQKYEVAK